MGGSWRKKVIEMEKGDGNGEDPLMGRVETEEGAC